MTSRFADRNARIAIASSVFLVLGLALGSSLRAEAVSTRIHVNSCKVLVAGYGALDTTAVQIDVRFENRSRRTLRTITWRATTPAGTVDVIDHGAFSPGVSIYRSPERLGPRFFARRLSLEAMGPGTCSVVRAVADDGTTWSTPDPSPETLRVPDVPMPDAIPVPASLVDPLQDPVGIVSCQFSMIPRRAFGYVRFVNLAATPLDRITFRALYGPAGMDFVLNGRYSPGVVVRAGDMTRRDLPPNSFQEYLTLDAPTSCIAVSAHYADGTLWTNANVSATEPPFPVIPDGYEAIAKE